MERLTPWAVYGLVSSTVCLPWLGPGFILTLDMVFTPRLPLPSEPSSDFLLYALLHLLGLLLPSDVVQKLLLLSIFLLAGVGMHLLFAQLRPVAVAGPQWRWGSYAAGLLYMINPFVYDRLMAGQWAVLLGYSLLPFVVRATVQFIERPRIKTMLVLCAWVILLSIASLHSLGLYAVVLLGLVGWGVRRYRRDLGQLGQLARFGLIAVGIVLLASSYWLVPLLQGRGGTATAVQHLQAGNQAFQTVGEGWLGALANVIRLQGFWAEVQGLYTLPQQVVPAWGVWMVGLWVIVATGLVWWWRRQRLMAALWLSVLAVSIVLATGVFQPWLSAVLPFWGGFREPQKFAGLIALVFAIGLGGGIVAIQARWRRPWALRASLALLLLPVLITPVLLWGAAGQLQPRQYPDDWARVDSQLAAQPGPKKEKDKGKVLFLPWHNYMSFDFSGRIIGNPARKFFQRPTIISNDPEFKDAQPTKQDPVATQLAGALARAPQRRDMAAQLARHDIQYIVLAKELDYRRYDYIATQPGLQRVTENDHLIVYKNNAYAK